MTYLKFQQQPIFCFQCHYYTQHLFFCDVTKRHDIPVPLLKVAHYFHTLSPRLGENVSCRFYFNNLVTIRNIIEKSFSFFLLYEDERYFLLYLLSNSEYKYTFFLTKQKAGYKFHFY